MVTSPPNAGKLLDGMWQSRDRLHRLPAGYLARLYERGWVRRAVKRQCKYRRETPVASAVVQSQYVITRAGRQALREAGLLP